MRTEIADRLLSLNHKFYSDFAEVFAQTRGGSQPGFQRLLDYLPQSLRRVVDVGCGNGRFGQFLLRNVSDIEYTGIDITEQFLAMAGESVDGTFLQRDISCSGFMDDLEIFDLCVCLAAMQHIPGRSNRLNLLQEMASHLSEDGQIFLSNWQFVHSSRQKRKILDWRSAGFDDDDLESNDYLLSWQGNGRAMRYVHFLASSEIAWLAQASQLTVVHEFRSDGKEGDLNLYSVLARRS